MSISVRGPGVRSQRVGIDKVNYVNVCAWSGSEVAECGKR